MNTKMCGCGYGEATHPFEGLEGLRVHVMGKGTCCREIVPDDEIPTDFHMQVFNDHLQEMCRVEGQEVTTYTLTDQRGYNFSDGVWSRPKKKRSDISIGENW